MAFDFNPSFWFVCRLCKHSFASTEMLKEHKLACHLGECLQIKCIIFEERLLNEEWAPESTLHQNQNYVLNTNPDYPDNNNEISFKERKTETQLDYDSARESSFKNPYVSLTRITEHEIKTLKTSPACKSQRQDKNSPKEKQEGRSSCSTSTAADEDFKLPQQLLRHERWDNNGSMTIDDDFGDPLSSNLNDDPLSLEGFQVKIESDDWSAPADSEVGITAGDSQSVNKPFMCETCFACFRTRQILKGHLLCHSSNKPFLCSKCPSAFKRKSDFARHSLIHAKVTKYKCRFCSKYFRENNTLLAHERRHTGDRPFKCPVADCSYAAVCNGHLIAHTRARHTEELGLQQFLCPTCGKTYGIRYLLDNHIRAQHCDIKPIHCTYQGCTKKFKFNRALRQHLTTHE